MNKNQIKPSESTSRANGVEPVVPVQVWCLHSLAEDAVFPADSEGVSIPLQAMTGLGAYGAMEKPLAKTEEIHLPDLMKVGVPP